MNSVRRMRCFYQINEARTTPEEINESWVRLFSHPDVMPLRVSTESDSLLLQARGFDWEQCPWWRRTGGGVTEYDSDDLPTIVALVSFFSAYRELFRHAWAGPHPTTPEYDSERGAWLSLLSGEYQGQVQIVRGEAV